MTPDLPFLCPTKRKPYLYNDVLGNYLIALKEKAPGTKTTPEAPMNSTAIESPAKTPMFHEGTRRLVQPYHSNAKVRVRRNEKLGILTWGTVAFADNHVKKVAPGRHPELDWSAGNGLR